MSDSGTAPEEAAVQVPRLTSVELVALSGERRASGVAPATNYRLDLAFQEVSDAYLFRLTGRGDLTDAEGVDYGFVEASVVAAFEACGWPQTQVEAFGQVDVMRLAYPYVREALSTTANRLGFFGVLLPPLELAKTPQEA